MTVSRTIRLATLTRNISASSLSKSSCFDFGYVNIKQQSSSTFLSSRFTRSFRHTLPAPTRSYINTFYYIKRISGNDYCKYVLLSLLFISYMHNSWVEQKIGFLEFYGVQFTFFLLFNLKTLKK